MTSNKQIIQMQIDRWTEEIVKKSVEINELRKKIEDLKQHLN